MKKSTKKSNEDNTVSINDQQLTSLTNRLDAIAKLLALNLPKEITLSDKIAILRGTGLQYKEIADILGTSVEYIGVALDRAKKGKKTESKKRGNLRQDEVTMHSSGVEHNE